MKGLLAVGALLALSLAGCGDDASGVVTGADVLYSRGVAGGVAGSYAYAGYDEKGVEIVTGTLTIVLEDSTRIAGTWELKAMNSLPPYRFGPQVGSGRLVGTLRGDMLAINLNPDYVDNNVFLSADCCRLRLTGRWEYAGFPGVLRRGTLSAVRITLNGAYTTEGEWK
jgi:hypothetical protein